MTEEPGETGKVTDGDRVMGGRIVYGYGSVQWGADAVLGIPLELLSDCMLLFTVIVCTFAC